MKKGQHLGDPESRRIIGEHIPLLSDEVSAEILRCWGFGLPFGRCGGVKNSLEILQLCSVAWRRWLLQSV
jgi:hypothetical protein